MERRAGPRFRQAVPESPLLGAALLVLDKDPAVRSMLVRLLTRAGACVSAMEPGALLEDRSTAPDAAICEGSSAGLLHALKLRRAYPNLPLILLDADAGHVVGRTVSIAKLDLVHRLLPALLNLMHRQ